MITTLLAALLQTQSAPVSLPGWMSGAWVSASESDWSEEWWTPPRGGVMLGGSRSGSSDKLDFFEHMRIVETGGRVEFCAMPEGKAGGCFPAIASDVQSITFENRTHDYPQRIRYWREGRNLRAEISLADGTKQQRWTYSPAGK